MADDGKQRWVREYSLTIKDELLFTWPDDFEGDDGEPTISLQEFLNQEPLGEKDAKDIWKSSGYDAWDLIDAGEVKYNGVKKEQHL